MDETELSSGLRHFIRLAKRGKHPAASGGEHRCRVIALALLDNVPGLDGSALNGLRDFANLIQSYPDTMRDIVDGWE